jgi:hypothetical protein
MSFLFGHEFRIVLRTNVEPFFENLSDYSGHELSQQGGATAHAANK